MSSVLCKSECKKFMLEYAATNRHHPFDRVSGDCWPYLEQKLRDHMRNIVASMPSKGKTLKP